MGKSGILEGKALLLYVNGWETGTTAQKEGRMYNKFKIFSASFRTVLNAQ